MRGSSVPGSASTQASVATILSGTSSARGADPRDEIVRDDKGCLVAALAESNGQREQRLDIATCAVRRKESMHSFRWRPEVVEPDHLYTARA